MNKNKQHIFNILRLDKSLRVAIIYGKGLDRKRVKVRVSTAFSTGELPLSMTSLARFQVPQNEGLTGNTSSYSPIINLENSSASNSAWPAKEPYREKKQSTDQT